jgi:hypothetical protein
VPWIWGSSLIVTGSTGGSCFIVVVDCSIVIKAQLTAVAATQLDVPANAIKIEEYLDVQQNDKCQISMLSVGFNVSSFKGLKLS